MFRGLFIMASFVNGVLAGSFAQFRRLENINTRLDVSIADYEGMSVKTCTSICATISTCLYISYQKDQQLCRTHTSNRNAVTDVGWNVYFKVKDQLGSTIMNLKSGATAFQSTTYDNLHAGLALDGDSNGDFNAGSCAHTQNNFSYWVMKFGTSGVVEKVVIHLRSDLVKRNTGRVVVVAQTSTDAVNNVGTDCGRYNGPVIDTEPFLITIQCSGPIFGRFLRISHTQNDLMEVCEVYLYPQ